MRRLVVGVVLLTSALAAPHARAYRTAQDLPELMTDAPVTWTDPRVRYWLRSEDRPPLPIATLERAVTAGFDVWNEPTCSSLTLTYGGVTAAVASPSDGYNTVAWVRDWTHRGFSADVAATTDVTFTRRGDDGRWIITDADILLNARHHRWSVGDDGDGGRDITAVVAHEVGHLVGLAHPCEDDGRDGAPLCGPEHVDTTMYPSYLGEAQRDLGEDDTAGLCALYPTESCQVVGCPLGQACVGHRCVTECTADDCMSPAPCHSDDDCEGGATCVRGGCVQGSRGTTGDPCGDDLECMSGVCHADGYCTSTCGADGRCGGAFECTEASGTCTSEGGVLGDRCERGRECSSGLCLLGTPEGTCTRACARALPCPDGFRCETVEGTDVCVPVAARADGCAAAAGRRPASGTWLWAVAWVLGLRATRRRGGRDAA